jgi:hypothetical protein
MTTGDGALRRASSAVSALSIGREQLLVLLAALCFVNGMVPRVLASATGDLGIWGALANTFGVSGIVWIAVWLGAEMAWSSPQSPIVIRREVWAVVPVAIATLVPLAELSWFAYSAVSAYALWISPSGSKARRGFVILLAVSVPMLWSRMLFRVFADTILQGDAVLVSLLVHTKRAGNAIAFADGSGYLWVASPCSSLANVSLAILCWMATMQLFARRLTLRDITWCAAACAGVVMINVIRLSLLASFPQYWELIHGDVGSSVVAWLILIVTVVICVKGVGHAQVARS